LKNPCQTNSPKQSDQSRTLKSLLEQTVDAEDPIKVTPKKSFRLRTQVKNHKNQLAKSSKTGETVYNKMER